MSQIHFCDLKRLNFTILNNYLYTQQIYALLKRTHFKMFNPGLLWRVNGTESASAGDSGLLLVQDDPTGRGNKARAATTAEPVRRGLCPGIQEPQLLSLRPAAGEATAERGRALQAEEPLWPQLEEPREAAKTQHSQQIKK